MKIISWDYDDTLYDWRNEELIDETLEIFNKERESNKMVITTYRNRNDTKDIRKKFPDTTIWATSGEDKAGLLLQRGVSRHYDDDILLCKDLLGTECEPVYICHDEEETMNGLIPFGMRYIGLWQRHAKSPAD